MKRYHILVQGLCNIALAVLLIIICSCHADTTQTTKFTLSPSALGVECGKEILTKCSEGSGSINAECGYEVMKEYADLQKVRRFTKEQKEEFTSAFLTYSKAHNWTW